MSCWIFTGTGVVSIPDNYVGEYAELHPQEIIFEAELVTEA